MQLIKKIFINGKIRLLSGMHIGGSSSALDIGGIDSNVIKDANGVPYIPGSSIKGKMRNLMEMKYSKYTQRTGKVDSGMDKNAEDGNRDIQKLFGSVAKEADLKARLIIRDAYLNEEILEEMKNKTGKFEKLELDYTEGKWENTVDRLTSSAIPRQLERVPAESEFDFSFVFTFYENSDNELLKMLLEGMQLLEDDYIGGSGTRGYGRIAFENITISEKSADDYKEHKNKKNILEGKKIDEINISELK
ncbi:MAG: type III-A CRISPR-associated RAMP protein Csm3 [Candidatus Marinimicrobia bacterium]|nr:type III-A CRISPR-associated RAMP protein Csm3 [Candidatus Neomarinimicrobiota bacterium]